MGLPYENATSGRNALDSSTWACPWGICNDEQAQACRTEPDARKGCSGRFPVDVSPDRAKRMIGYLPKPEGPKS